MRPQRVLVTGGRGFIGSHVVRLLGESGRNVALLAHARHADERPADIPADVALLTLHERQGERGSSIRQWGPDACIHLAWHTEPGKYLDSSQNLTSLTNCVNVLQAVIEAGCDRIAMAGTCAEYDASKGWLREDSPTRPETLYAATKLSACLIAEQLAARHDVHLAWGRIFFPYGPGEDARRAVPSVIRSLLRRQPFPASLGEQVRDFIHVEDVASAFLALIDAPARGIFNISSAEPVTMRRVMETIGEILGERDLIEFGALPYRAWDPMFICGENSRLQETGWQRRYPLREGLTETVEWWRAQS